VPKYIELKVSTGWANGTHVEQQDLPEDWEELTSEEKESILDEMATDFLHEKCQGYAHVVEE
jgi:hypothetical protein